MKGFLGPVGFIVSISILMISAGPQPLKGMSDPDLLLTALLLLEDDTSGANGKTTDLKGQNGGVMPGMEMNGGKMVDSTKPGCTGVKCLDPGDDQKVEGCKELYPDASTGLQACCPIWTCESKVGEKYNNGTLSGTSGDFPNGPPANKTLPPKLPNSLPPGSNLQFQTQDQAYVQKAPGMQASGRSSSYSYSSSSFSSSGGDGTGGPPMPMPMPIPMG